MRHRPPAPDARFHPNAVHCHKATLIALVHVGCPPLEASYAAQLPTWLLDADFAAKFRRAVNHGERAGHCSSEEADRRMMAELEAFIDAF